MGDKARRDFVRQCDKEYLYCISESECANNVIQESPAVADKPARRESMPKIVPIRRENKPSGGTPININEIYTSMKNTFSGLQFCR